MYDSFQCGNPALAFGYHISFQVIVSQVFLNIFIAIIIDSLAEQEQLQDLPLSASGIDGFVKVWSEFDPKATGFIETKVLEKFVVALAKDGDGGEFFPNEYFRQRLSNDNIGEGMSVDEQTRKLKYNKRTRYRFLAGLDIPTYGWKQVYFYDVLQTLSQRLVSITYGQKRNEKTKTQLEVLRKLG
jgi:hypothetical protein